MKRKPTESLREQILQDYEDYQIVKNMYRQLGIDIEALKIIRDRKENLK